jgi:hypothetical protein
VTSAEYQSLMTYLAATRTRVRRAASKLIWAKVNSRPTEHEMRWLLGYEAARLSQEMLDAAGEMAALVTDEDQIEDLRRGVRDLGQALRRSALASKLEETEGRTPEEREAFLAKAATLRSGT